MKKKNLLLLSLLLIPQIVLAKSNGQGTGTMAIFIEAFVTIHMTIFVIKPLSKILGGGTNDQKWFWTLFSTRVIILIIGDLINPTIMYIIDFISIFIGTLIVEILTAKNNDKNSKMLIDVVDAKSEEKTKDLICANCGNTVNINDNFCYKCGNAINHSLPIKDPKLLMTPTDFDQVLYKQENEMLKTIIEKELAKAGIEKTDLIPSAIIKKKNMFSIVLSILLCVFIIMIFFHFPLYTYIIGGIILIIFASMSKKYNTDDYLMKKIKSRPNEKISNIIMSEQSSLTKDSTKIVRLISMIIAIVIPLLIFYKPVILYEKIDNGYSVRYYAFGLTEFTKAEIPAEHKGEPVVSLRGNCFSNMPLLKEVILPETITEIRGQAFKNDRLLKKVNIPSQLEYLGGGAFYNCFSIEEIELPDTLTEMGGEVFYNATSLKKVKLSENLTEIRGNSFENCSSLEKIDIPDKIERIGGHAFYGCSSLKEVNITEFSQLNAIGSSAFRQCSSLMEITIPKKTTVDIRSFKESPTNVKRFG